MGMTFGVEEEFVLLDPELLSPVEESARALRELASAHSGVVVHEFLQCQIEFVSPVFDTSSDAVRELQTFRSILAAWAADTGVIAASAGTPFRALDRAAVSGGRRYSRIAARAGGLAPQHQVNGLHVHLGIPDREERVRICTSLRPWLPTLLALSANSPFWRGQDTMFGSWRAILNRRLMTHGIPPAFADATAYDDAVRTLMGIGMMVDDGTVNWNARLSHLHPTLEVRVCDAQLTAQATVGLAVLVRALASSIPRPRITEPFDGLWDAALWHAARYGMTARLVDPWTGALVPAARAARTLYAAAEPALRHQKDGALARSFLTSILRRGTGATAQRAAYREGTEGLAELYRSQLAGAIVPAESTHAPA